MRTKNLMLAMSALAIAGCSQNEITEISPDANPAVGFEVYTGVQLSLIHISEPTRH